MEQTLSDQDFIDQGNEERELFVNNVLSEVRTEHNGGTMGAYVHTVHTRVPRVASSKKARAAAGGQGVATPRIVGHGLLCCCVEGLPLVHWVHD